MSKCEQCIVREFSSLALTKQELVQLSECKTSHIVKRRNHFKEGDTVNGIYCIKDGVCNSSSLAPTEKTI
jgi:hypothetical protein